MNMWTECAEYNHLFIFHICRREYCFTYWYVAVKSMCSAYSILSYLVLSAQSWHKSGLLWIKLKACADMSYKRMFLYSRQDHCHLYGDVSVFVTWQRSILILFIYFIYWLLFLGPLNAKMGSAGRMHLVTSDHLLLHANSICCANHRCISRIALAPQSSTLAAATLMSVVDRSIIMQWDFTEHHNWICPLELDPRLLTKYLFGI